MGTSERLPLPRGWGLSLILSLVRLHLSPRHPAVWPVKFTRGRSYQDPLPTSTHRGCQAASCPFSRGRCAQPASHSPAPAAPPDWSSSLSSRVHIGASGKACSLDRGALITGSSQSLSLPFPFFRDRLQQHGSVEWDVQVRLTRPALPCPLRSPPVLTCSHQPPPALTCPHLFSPVPTRPHLCSHVLTSPHRLPLSPPRGGRGY